MEINKENLIATAGDVLKHIGFLIVQWVEGAPEPTGQPANIQYYRTSDEDNS